MQFLCFYVIIIEIPTIVLVACLSLGMNFSCGHHLENPQEGS